MLFLTNIFMIVVLIMAIVCCFKVASDGLRAVNVVPYAFGAFSGLLMMIILIVAIMSVPESVMKSNGMEKDPCTGKWINKVEIQCLPEETPDR